MHFIKFKKKLFSSVKEASGSRLDVSYFLFFTFEFVSKKTGDVYMPARRPSYARATVCYALIMRNQIGRIPEQIDYTEQWLLISKLNRGNEKVDKQKTSLTDYYANKISKVSLKSANDLSASFLFY